MSLIIWHDEAPRDMSSKKLDDDLHAQTWNGDDQGRWHELADEKVSRRSEAVTQRSWLSRLSNSLRRETVCRLRRPY